MMTIDSESLLAPPGFSIPQATDLLIHLAPGVDTKAFFDDPPAALGAHGNWAVGRPTRPTDLVNFGQVQNLPLVLAGLVALLAVATLAHTLITAIRRRRRDLAILKMLGFVPRQVRQAVAWQATTFVFAALLIGLPLGIAIGRVTWDAFASQLGAVVEPVYPLTAIALSIPAAILAANLIATAPAFIAGRLKPAPVLRAE
jgi:ABC-type antimicrobial peptide transport system permease subunit